MYAQKQKDNSKSIGRSKILIILGLLVALAALVAVLELTNTTYWLHDKVQPVTASPETKGEPETANPKPATNPSTPGTTPTQSESDKATGTDPNAKLRQPSGEFVSSHHVSKATPLASVCTTTPGATCKITFTQGETVKSLEPRVADRGGSAYWDQVSAQSIGLGTGNWKIQAVATLGSQTQTADDAMSLEVSE